MHIGRHLIALSIGALYATTLQAQEALTQKNSAQAFCDMGYFEVGGQAITFPEIIVEGNRVFELNEKGPITAFGYIYDIQMAKDPMEATRAKLFGEGTCWKSQGSVTADYMTQVDILFEPFEIADDDYKKIRMALLKTGDLLGSKALIKVTGQFKNYSNTFEPYFSATSLEVVAAGQ